MRAVIGLGNPGSEHEYDRHNAGFMVLDFMAERLRASEALKAHRSRIKESSIAGERVLLVKPQTYMNASGEAAASVARCYRLAPERFVVVYDDLDLPLGSVRVRPDGGAGGHRGMESLIEGLGSRTFCRVRLGIGRPEPGLDVVTYVLSPFSDEERPVARKAVIRAADAIESVIREGPTEAMNRFNGLP